MQRRTRLHGISTRYTRIDTVTVLRSKDHRQFYFSVTKLLKDSVLHEVVTSDEHEKKKSVRD